MENLKFITENAIIAPLLLLSMFFISGIQKIYKFSDTVVNLQSKIKMEIIPEFFYKLAIVLVILLEILAPIIIMYFFFTNKSKHLAYYASLALVLFTIIVTIVYHPPVWMNYYKSIPFWANISLIGGLLILAKHITHK